MESSEKRQMVCQKKANWPGMNKHKNKKIISLLLLINPLHQLVFIGQSQIPDETEVHSLVYDAVIKLLYKLGGNKSWTQWDSQQL